MPIEVKPSKSSAVRAALERHPDASPAEIARMVGVRAREVRTIIGREPRRRRKSVASDAATIL